METPKEEKAVKKTDKLKEELEKAKADVEHWKNEYYRAYADTKNLRDSLQKDHLEALRYRSEGFIEELLPVLDSFHMALNNEVKDEAVKNYLTGFQFIYKNLVSVLENEGVKEYDPKIGDKFNPDFMNAVDTIEAEEAGKVARVYSKGYALHERMIRPANVTVTVKKEEKKEENKPQNNIEA